MDIIIKRVSKFFAFLLIYGMISYSYLIAKGFVIEDGTPVLSNTAQAEVESFSKEVKADFIISDNIKRVLGNANAPLTMYIFSSMTCSHCKDYHKYILPKVQRDFVSTNKLKVVYVHLPLDVVSMRAAKLGYCLQQDKFYEYITELYGTKDWLFAKTDEVLDKYAKKYGLTDAEIKKCNDDKKLTSDILMTRDNAVNNIGITGTPSFIVESKNKKELIASHKYGELKEYLEGLLENK